VVFDACAAIRAKLDGIMRIAALLALVPLLASCQKFPQREPQLNLRVVPAKKGRMDVMQLREWATTYARKGDSEPAALWPFGERLCGCAEMERAQDELVEVSGPTLRAPLSLPSELCHAAAPESEA